MSNRFIPDRTRPAADVPPAYVPGASNQPVISSFERPLIEVITPGQVALATFLGGPLAGGIAISMSHQRVGSPRTARPVLVGVLVLFALAFLAYLIGVTGGILFPLLGIGIMRAYAGGQQGFIDESVGGRTQPGSWGTPIAIGLLVALAMGILYFVTVSL